jgi:RHS repeat-associated protein
MIHNDHLGTPQKMTDSTGTVVWSADYKPFGEATVTISTITNNLRFPGQYFDAETGLNYNYFRDYNPMIGRYVEADPWNTGVIRLYRSRLKMSIRVLRLDRVNDLRAYPYATEDPIRFTDLLGLDSDAGGQQYSCLSICLGGLLKDKWSEFQCCVAKAGIGGVSIGTVTCAMVAVFEPYLLPALPACIGITSASTAVLGIVGCMLKLEVGGLGGVAGCIAGCSGW